MSSEPVADAEGEEGVVRLGPVVGFLPLQAPRLVVHGVELPHLEPDAPFLRDVPLQLQADRGGDDVAAEERMVRPLAVARVESARRAPHALDHRREVQGVRELERAPHAVAQTHPLVGLDEAEDVPERRDVRVLQRLEVAVLPQSVPVRIPVAEERVPHAARRVHERHVLAQLPVVSVERPALELVERRTVQLVLAVVQHAEETPVAVQITVVAEREVPVEVLERDRTRVAEGPAGRQIGVLELRPEHPGESPQLVAGN